MKKRIKTKILLGFLLIIGVLVAAGSVSIYEFIRISGLVEAMIKDNYKTIQAGKTMLEAVERMDSGVLLLLLGQFGEGTRVMHSADSAFNEALKQAEGNITEEGETDVVANIRKDYAIYQAAIDKTDDDTHADNLKWYQDDVHNRFGAVKSHVNALIEMNQDAMFIESSQLAQQSKRALMPGIVAIVTALLFLLMLNFFISRFFVEPLVRLKNSIDEYCKNPEGHLTIDLPNSDEIGDLGIAVEKLVGELKRKRG
jgi:methyl-accepting chemotaxis protein